MTDDQRSKLLVITSFPEQHFRHIGNGLPVRHEAKPRVGPEEPSASIRGTLVDQHIVDMQHSLFGDSSQAV